MLLLRRCVVIIETLLDEGNGIKTISGVIRLKKQLVIEIEER